MENTSTVFERSDNFFRRPYSITGIFAAAILLFLLPFVQVKCASTILAENTGIGIARGGEWKVATDWGGSEYAEQLKVAMKAEKSGLKEKPNIFALAALVIGVLGIAFSLMRSEWRSIICMCAGILGAIMLIALMIQIKMVMRSATGKDDVSIGMSGMIKVQFTIWFFLSLFGFASAGYLGFKHNRDELDEKMKHAKDFEFEKGSSEY